MAASAKWDDDDGINEINVTPLVDVMLVLLVIFMVASIYIVKDAIEVDLPKAASAGEALDTRHRLVAGKAKSPAARAGADIESQDAVHAAILPASRSWNQLVALVGWAGRSMAYRVLPLSSTYARGPA